MSSFDERGRVENLTARLARLDVAEVGGFTQGGQGVALGEEFVRDVTFVAGGDNAAHHAVPLHFLSTVEFVATGDAAGVEVAHPLNVFLHGANQITFHDLHVVDVVKELDVGRVDGRDHFDTPGRVVAHVVVMIHL